MFRRDPILLPCDNIPPAPSPSPSPWPWVSPGNGVMMQEGYITASFNALNQPMAMWSSAYGTNFLWFGYDPLGRCVKRWKGTGSGEPVGVNPTTYFYYDGWNMIQEGPSASVADRTYVHGGRVDEIVASRAASVWHYHHYDARGHCILLTDTSGVIREQYDYDAFGFPYFYTVSGGKLIASQQWGNRFLFTGREWLGDLRIYDFRARQYQPELGRFLQPDPKEFEAGDYNLYRYCHNDPINKTDPMGLTWADLMRWQGGRAGTVSEQRSRDELRQKLIAALDHLAVGLQNNQNEGAGMINSKGEAVDGPPSQSGLHSGPGLKPDSQASYHIHRLGVPGAKKGSEYYFSENPGLHSDSLFLKNYPNIPHYVGVLDGPPGKFTIFGYDPEGQSQFWVRPNYGVTPGFYSH